MEAMKGLQNLYDGVDDVWAFIRGAIDGAISGTMDTNTQGVSTNPDNAICSKPTDALRAVDDWGNFFLQEPILYFRLSRTIDLSLAAGRYSEDSSLSLLLTSERLPSPSMVFVEVDVRGPPEREASESDKATGGHEKVVSELGDGHFEFASQMFGDIGDLDGCDLGMDCLHTSQLLDEFELNLVDMENGDN
ncbi:hypothetical protein IL306_013294 [Fusarium sp. DS 682]|nr:hypothetical protein IL306_013294 [Fusarium sp. DS 682]